MLAGNLAQLLFEQKKLKTQFDISKVKRENTVIAFHQTVLPL